MQSKFYGMLGLSAKAGKAASGAFAAEKAIKSGEAVLAIIAGDASDNTKKLYEGMCGSSGIKLVSYGTKELLGRAVGKDERTIIAITDEGFAKGLLGKLTDSGEE